jgi:nucleoside 2-deoxyribosyltransferase
MFGHWWACEPCWKALIDAGVRDVYVVDDAHERFSRDKVYGETLTPTVKSAYIAGPITNVEDFESQKKFYEALGRVAEEMGCRTCIPHRDNAENQKSHLEKKAAAVYAWATGAVHDCDVVVADVSVPSLGTGGELVEAQREGKHIVLLSKKGSRVSAFVRGNPAVVYHIEYDDEATVVRQLKNVLRQL